MNSPSKFGLFLACALGLPFSSSSATVNDGSSTNNLVQLVNAFNDSPDNAVVVLDVVSNSVLSASQIGDTGTFAVRSAWYAADLAPTSGVYTVTSDFRPDADNYPNCGGVMGWLNLASSNGIAFHVTPIDPSFLSETSFTISVIDFSATNADSNFSFNHLFNTDGSAADSRSAVSAAGPNYSATDFASFQLAFTTPTVADLAAVSNATAHITAKVFQGTNAGGAPLQVGQTTEMLTDLPLPGPSVHRFGYYAFWGSFFDPGGVIGSLDNLTAEGGVGLPPNAPPTVNITGPTNGATFTEPASITIAAAAADSDGAVAHVDFFAGSTLLGTATNASNSVFSFTWNNVVAGSYSLTAQATDNRGGVSTSSPVNITVSASTGGGPTMTLTNTGGTIDISWPVTGYQLQMTTNLSSPNWTDVAINTVNTNHVTLQITAANMFFRLVQAGAPTGPALTIQPSSNSVVISWPAQVTGYRLQSKTDLNTASWTDIATSNNQFTETISGSAKFYRLISP
ncbi:MAG TPA: Ig-like domain-containing protein [Candidatus Angelobacter sp.]|nr:Ig-like domain-containing protein [Candidatus Angelobacter sp.]